MMTETLIEYDNMVQMALLSVVKNILNNTARDGLPGDHHFYITFATGFAGVSIPDYLRKRYPDEMTIVIQNQFSNLVVSDDFFEISLSFNGKLEQLHIPFLALEGFFDPSVDFGLHFHGSDDEDDLPAIVEAASDIPEIKQDEVAPNDKDDVDTDNVVTLDAFRKK